MVNRAIGHSTLRYALALAIAFAGFTLGAWLYLSPTWGDIHREWWLVPLLLAVDGISLLIAAYIAGMLK